MAEIHRRDVHRHGGSAAKAATAKANGYTHVIDYRAEDFPARVKEITGGKGCDVVYDSVGNDTWRGSLKCLQAARHVRLLRTVLGADHGFQILRSGRRRFAVRDAARRLFDYIKTREDLEPARGRSVRASACRCR